MARATGTRASHRLLAFSIDNGDLSPLIVIADDHL